MPVSVEEYLALDRAAEIKSEYHDGEMFPIESVTWIHSRIGVKVAGWLDRQLAHSPCRVAGPALRVRVTPTKFVVPDFIVVCGKPVLTDEHQDTVTNPKVIIEILSPSTKDYDYGGKFEFYRRLASFEEYILISQNRPRIETFRKTAENRWVLSIFDGLESVAAIESLGLAMPLSEVYDGIELPAVVED
ncbi:MAG TPA: Uma2 family endonuclease [Bryobacteraceae bacterium]|jgi:Uma2 family endonuclease